MTTFNPSRLILARKRRGMTKKALADKAEISTKSLTWYEQGIQYPTSGTQGRLAQALEFPIAFFHGRDLNELPVNATSFRALTKMTAQQRDRAIAAGTLAALLSDWIAEYFTLPHPEVPQLRGVDPETAAEVVRGRWNLGERSIRNMVHLLELHGIRVFSLVEECREVDAFSTWRDGIPYVFLNTMKSAERSRMDAAHELGHLVLHWHHDIPRGRQAEDEAKAFASAFLMPSASVKAHAPRGAALPEILKVKRHWGVAASALVYRMHKLGLLTEWEYRALFKLMSKRGDLRKEPRGLPKRETSQLLDKVFKSLRADGITKADVARQLSIPASELNNLVFGLVLTTMPGEKRAGTETPVPAKRNLRLV